MIKIRPAKIKEAREIAKLNVELMKHHLQYDELYKIKKNAADISEKWYKKSPRSSRSLLLVAEIDKKIVGYISANIRKRPPIYLVEEWGGINGIYVQFEYRHMGIGKMFIEAAFNWFKKKEVKYIDLDVDTNNEVAKMLWKKYKFKEYWKKMYRKI